MILLAVSCAHHRSPVAVRERLAFRDDQLGPALDTLNTHLGWEAVILSTCNRVELYLGQPVDSPERSRKSLAGSTDVYAQEIVQFLADFHALNAEEIRSQVQVYHQGQAVEHLFRVAASLDSLIIGEAQIAGQVKRAYERAQEQASVGPLLHTLFRHARQVARRVRTETGIAHGHVSVSSAAVDYVRQVFDHFGDKTVLVIGAGKMGELTLRHLKQLRPRHILVTNRSPDKAREVAQGCGGEAVPWERLDEVLARADIALSTTGAPEPIMTLERYQRVVARRSGGPLVILDIAVPRDFDPRIHDGDRTCLFNIDDLKRIRDATLSGRRKHLSAAEDIVGQEVKRFLKDWARRRHGPVIERLTRDLDAKRQEVVRNVFARLNGKLTEADRRYLEKAFCLLQNQFLHGPIRALTEESPEAPAGHSLLDALRKLFRLHE